MAFVLWSLGWTNYAWLLYKGKKLSSLFEYWTWMYGLSDSKLDSSIRRIEVGLSWTRLHGEMTPKTIHCGMNLFKSEAITQTTEPYLKSPSGKSPS